MSWLLSALAKGWELLKPIVGPALSLLVGTAGGKASEAVKEGTQRLMRQIQPQMPITPAYQQQQIEEENGQHPIYQQQLESTVLLEEPPASAAPIQQKKMQYVSSPLEQKKEYYATLPQRRVRYEMITKPE